MEDRNPPQDIEAEMTVLGAILIDGDTYKVAKAILEPGDFRHKAHETIFSAMGELHERGSVVELVVLKDHLKLESDMVLRSPIISSISTLYLLIHSLSLLGPCKSLDLLGVLCLLLPRSFLALTSLLVSGLRARKSSAVLCLVMVKTVTLCWLFAC